MAKKIAPKAEAKAKADPSAKAAYMVVDPIKTLDGMVMPGETIELTAKEAVELIESGVLVDPDAATEDADAEDAPKQ